MNGLITFTLELIHFTLGMAMGACRPDSTRPDSYCATRMSYKVRTRGRTHIDPCSIWVEKIRYVMDHGTNRVGKNFPQPPLFFMSKIILILRG